MLNVKSDTSGVIARSEATKQSREDLGDVIF